MAQTENRRVNIYINTDEAQKNQQKLFEKSEKLKKEIALLTEGTQEFADKSKELEKVSVEYTKVSDKISGKLAPSLKDLKNQLSTLNRELSNLSVGTQAFADKQKQISEVSSMYKTYSLEVKRIGEAMKETFAGGGLQNFSSVIGNLLKGGAIIGIATQVFSVAKEFLALTNEVNKTRESVAKFSSLTGDALNNTTAKTRAVAESFGKDFNEVLLSANSLSKSMGISFDESLTLIEKGFLKGADTNGDFLDKLKEYPIQFKEAGYSAEDFIKIAVQEVKGGVFNDKLLDTVKELGLSLRELPKASKDALTNAFGSQFAGELAKNIDSGKVNTVQALQLIQAESQKTNLSVSQVQTLVADVFKGAGEDIGGLEQAFTQINNAMAINLNELTDQEQQVKANTQANEEYNKALISLSQNFAGVGTSFSTFFTNIFTSIVKATNAVIEFFSLADSRSKKLVANLSYNNTEEAKKSILTVQAQLNAEREKAKKLQTLIDSGLGKTQTRIDLVNVKDSIKVLEKAIQDGENKLNDIKQKAADKNVQITKEQTQANLAQQDIAAKASREKLQQRIGDEMKLILDELSLYEKVEKPLEIDFKVKINDFDTDALKKKVDENLAKATQKRNNANKATANNDVLDAQSDASVNSLFGDSSKNVVNAKLAELAVLQSIELQNKELTESEKLNIQKKYIKQAGEIEGESNKATANKIIDLFSQAYSVVKQFNDQRFENEMNEVNAAKENRLTSLESEKQAELAKYADNKDKQQEINAKYESAKAGIESEFAKQSADIKTRQAKSEKMGKIFEAVIATAAAVVKALPNIPLSVIAGVIGAAQIGLIASTPIPNFGGGESASKVGGFKSGGFTPSAGSDSTPVGIVHANEYVIPAPLLRTNPVVANFA